MLNYQFAFSSLGLLLFLNISCENFIENFEELVYTSEKWNL
jgi:hypothetical protein